VVMVYTLQFNLLGMMNYFGFESNAKLNIALAQGLLEHLQQAVMAAAISQ